MSDPCITLSAVAEIVNDEVTACYSKMERLRKLIEEYRSPIVSDDENLMCEALTIIEMYAPNAGVREKLERRLGI